MDADLISSFDQGLIDDRPRAVGVAVSGGSDSLALLYLLNDICKKHDIPLAAVTVDHGLRRGSAEEAQNVALHCAALGVVHSILNWHGWDRQGNTQDAARRARYGLITDWALQENIPVVALGHTLDDQAETVLMRLARGSGTDGLSAMSASRRINGVTWARPLLNMRRRDLRSYLTGLGVTWADDPGNEDTRFERIKMRQALKVLEPLGIDAATLGQVAGNMQQARLALNQQVLVAARQSVTLPAGAVVIDTDDWQALNAEIARRLMVRTLCWINGAGYAPRRRAVAAFSDALQAVGSATLAGCQGRVRNGAVWIFREFSAVDETRTPTDACWDGRWCVRAPDVAVASETRALGPEGLKLCPGWRETGLPREVLLSSPAIWHGDDLIAAPLAGHANGWHVTLKDREEAFFDALLSH